MSTTCKTKTELDKLTRLYDLDLLSLNTTFDNNLNPADYCSKRITSWYFSPHSFKEMKTKLSKDETISGFSVFHNNIVNLNHNLENLQNQLLHEVDFHFNVIGVTESKITTANSQMCIAHQCTWLRIWICSNASGVWGRRNVYWRISWLSYFRKDL